MLDVEAYPVERHRAARRVEAGVADKLIIGRELHVRPLPGQLQPVVGLEDLFACVVEVAVSQQKAQTAGGKILTMPGRESLVRDRNADLNGDRDRNADDDRYGYGYGNIDADDHSNGHCDVDQDRDCNADLDGHRDHNVDCDRNVDGHANVDGNCDGDGNLDWGRTDSDADAGT